MENQQKHPTERILQAWSESKGNLQIGEENTKELEAVFTAVQKEMNFLSSRVSMVMNSIRLIKSQDTCQMRENKKENYTYIDATGAEVTATRQEVIEELKTLAQQAKTARYPVRETTMNSIVTAVDSINKVVLAPGEYFVRVLGIYWDPNSNQNNRRLKYIFETQNNDLFAINLYKNKDFEYYSPAKQKDVELKSPDMWLQTLIINIGISPSTTFFTLESIEVTDADWAEDSEGQKELNQNEQTV